MNRFLDFLYDRGSETFADNDDYVRVVLPSDYPDSRMLEKLYVAAGLLR